MPVHAPRLVLVKHAQPVLDPTTPAREWQLSEAGEAQSRRLAASLREFLPCRLVASPEPKAARTAEVVGTELGVASLPVGGLEEIDRPVLPILSPAEHERVNAAIFTDRDRAALGNESAEAALARFSHAVIAERDRARADGRHLIVITHGTVIALFVAAHNVIDPFALWKRLQCPALVVLDATTLALAGIVDQVV